MENNDKFLSQDLLESYAIRLLSGPLNGCEYEILNADESPNDFYQNH